MQLLDSTLNQLSDWTNRRLLDTFQDIANNVELDSELRVHHPNYKSLELPPEIVERLQKMPSEIQQKHLNLQLRSFLYGIYYNGWAQTTLAPEVEESSQQLDLENNTVQGIDPEFYEQLHQSNYGKGRFDPGWLILKEESDGTLAVTKGGLRLHIEPDKHLPPAQQNVDVGDSAAIWTPKNRVQNGFYMAVSNVRGQSDEFSNDFPGTVRIYCHLSPEGAMQLMSGLTRQLNNYSIPFSFKVVYNPAEYKRYDSGVLYFDQTNYELVRGILQTIYIENQSCFKSEVPLFTKELAPGLGLAEEPNNKFEIQESFGMNRCQIVANGLLKARSQGDNSPENRIKAILEEFSIQGISLQYPYLNAESEDMYTPLEL